MPLSKFHRLLKIFVSLKMPTRYVWNLIRLPPWHFNQVIERPESWTLSLKNLFLNAIRVRTPQYFKENTTICEAKIGAFFLANLYILTWIELIARVCHNYVYPWQPENLKMPIFLDNRKSRMDHHLHQAVFGHGRYTGVPHTYLFLIKKWGSSGEEGTLPDAFFPIKSWSADIKMVFWKKPTGDQGTFKLMLFNEGNGCSPNLMRTWILLSQAWNEAKTAEKRSKQIDFIVDSLEQKRASWFYFYINYGKLLLFNGQPKN